MTNGNAGEVKEEKQYITFAEYLEEAPPNQSKHISDLSIRVKSVSGTIDKINTPEIQLHCNHERCKGTRFFRCTNETGARIYDNFHNYYIEYQCSNCQNEKKVYSLAAKIEQEGKQQGECLKFGELPSYGPPIPPKLIKLIGPDRDEFLKGRRCENQGLGVGAFIYYRRVVENQKNRIIEEIVKVSEKIGMSKDKIKILSSAISETQFSKAFDIAKDVIPESLFINGHSPISLLHSALSEGVHKLSDEQCLELAGSIRIVLGELSERLSNALKDEYELKKAISSLLNRKSEK